MGTMKIEISNQSGVNKQFMLFQDMPAPSEISVPPFSNVYLHSPIVGNQGETVFSLPNTHYAIFGTISDNGNNMVTTNESIQVALGPGGTYLVLSTRNEDGTDFYWDTNAAINHKSTTPGSFVISADTSFTYFNKENIAIGCGAQGPGGEVVPVQSFRAEPGTTTRFFPVPKYYIAFGNFQPGTVVDRTTLGNVLHIDFTNATRAVAKFTLNSNGAYVPDSIVAENGVNWSYGDFETT